ncbi:hypothetical protein K8P10_002467 [Leucobacter sp. Psy1]|uniref:SRPBCC family protein n=1 Tax=Leucobacter sp. Psy1 TaxID=2875729 RepID=UPI001CD3CC6A|nr:SRPBCC domain-containing protein [Leucobacter sp. Psy1]UBH06956.1 hypothetical protein K8P10_002467 [Leucobacter sp. Psy1]
MVPVGPVVARCQTAQPRRVLWAYLSDPDLRAEWWPELNLESRLGGTVREQWAEGDASRDASGEIDVFVDGHALGFRWTEAGDPRPTAVLITLRSIGAGASLTVTETGFDMLPDPSARAAASQEGWDVLLRDLSAAIDDLDEDDAATAVATAEAAAADTGAESEAGEAETEFDAKSETENPVADDADEAETGEREIEDAVVVDAEVEDAEVVDAEVVVDEDVAEEGVVDEDVVEEAVIEGAPEAEDAASDSDDAGDAGPQVLARIEPDEPAELPEAPVDSESAAWAASGVNITVNGGAGDDDDDEWDTSTDFDRLLRGR